MDLRSLQREIERMQRELDELKARIPNLPVRWGGGGGGNQPLFLVRTTSDGGSAGVNKVSVATLTYTVKDITNTETLATGKALTGNGNGWRGLKIALTAGTYGLAYYETDGTLTLVWVDEKPAGEQDCT